MKDKLWFYGAYSNQAVDQGQVGLVLAPNADGCWFVTCGGTTPATFHTDLPGYSAKVSYQMTQNTKLIGVDMYAVKHLSDRTAAARRFRWRPPASSDSRRRCGRAKSRWPRTSSCSTRILRLRRLPRELHRQPASQVIVGFPDGTDVVGNPSSRELSNSLRYGPSINPEDRPQNRLRR